MQKICGVYKITNTITGDFYIGSSKDIKRRWREHKKPSTWKRCPNNPMYLDMQKYGLDKFVFEIIEVVEIEQLKVAEQHFIETLKPTYNNYRAKGRDAKKFKERQKKYRQSEKGKERQKEYEKTDKRKKYLKEYQNQLCCYNGETLTLQALSKRFSKAGIPHPTIEAKKYLIKR